MTQITREELDHFKEQALEKESEFLVSLMLESDNESVRKLLKEVLMVAKLVHGEELEEKIGEYKISLIHQRLDAILKQKNDELVLHLKIEAMCKKTETPFKSIREKMKKGWNQ